MTTISVYPRATDTETGLLTHLRYGLGVSDVRAELFVLAHAGTATMLVESGESRLRGQFHALADWWHEATDALSSPDEKADHAAYQRIIGLGHPVLRYILEDLRDHGGHWFMALEEITHMEPPIRDGVTPSLRAERDAWLSWGRALGILD